MKHTTIRRAAAVLALVLVVTACGGDDSASSGGGGGGGGGPVSTVPPDTDTGSIPDATGPADDSLEPVRIGMINMDEGTPSYPDVSVGVDAAADLVNAELGGIHGRPVEIVHCSVTTDQATNQSCAQQFANDPTIGMVINGYVFGSAFVFPILDSANVPVLLQTPLTQHDYEAPNGFAYQGGNAGGTSGTASYAGKFLDAESIVILGADNDALRAAVDVIEGLPAMEGVDISTTYIPDTAADVTADVQASGAASADAVLSLVNAPQCVQVAQSLIDLSVTAPIVSVATCAVPSTLAESPELFDGWTIVGSGLPPLLAEGASAELDYYRETFPQYGPEANMDSFLTLGGFGAMLAAWQIGNDLPEELSRDDWSEGLASFTGPYFGGQDEFSCPGEHFPAVCTNDVRAFVLDGDGVMSQVEDFFDPLA